MTKEELYGTLKERFKEVLLAEGQLNESVEVVCRALSPEEAIGNTKRKDYPILTGKDVMIQAEYRGFKGQAFTDAPAAFSGTLAEVLALDIVNDAHNRSLFIAVLNAVMRSLGRCTDTVHCRADGPEKCSCDVREYLKTQRPDVKSITLVGYQPSLLHMLTNSGYRVRVMDLNPQNVGQTRCGVMVEDGRTAMKEAVSEADLILCTGSTLSNGTIVDYLDLNKDVLFFGITAAGAAALLGLNRICFASRYSG